MENRNWQIKDKDEQLYIGYQVCIFAVKTVTAH